jgi:hypothetical protein
MNKHLANLLTWIDVKIYLPKDGDVVEVKGKYKDPNGKDSMIIGRMIYKDKKFIDEQTSHDWTNEIEYWRYGITALTWTINN